MLPLLLLALGTLAGVLVFALLERALERVGREPDARDAPLPAAPPSGAEPAPGPGLLALCCDPRADAAAVAAAVAADPAHAGRLLTALCAEAAGEGERALDLTDEERAALAALRARAAA